MAKKRTYTANQKQEALTLYEAAGPTAVEKQLGIPKNTVARWAKDAGVSTVRNEKTSAATEARIVDSKALRATLAQNTLAVVQQASNIIGERLATEGHDTPLKDVATIFGIFVDKHNVLVRMDQANEDYSAVDAWLDHITDGERGRIGEEEGPQEFAPPEGQSTTE